MVSVLKDSRASVSSLMLADDEAADGRVLEVVTTEGPEAGMVMMVRWRGTSEVESGDGGGGG